jgi:hypothetical protein
MIIRAFDRNYFIGQAQYSVGMYIASLREQQPLDGLITCMHPPQNVQQRSYDPLFDDI